MFAPGDRVGIAVSGGADSVFLLHALFELAPRWGLRLSVVHLDHKLRGAASRADAAFTRDLAIRFGLQLHTAEADIASAQDNLEQAARLARRKLYMDLLQAGRVDRIAANVEWTSKCNALCAMCPREAIAHPKIMAAATWRQVLERLSPAEIFRVVLAGYGEPTTHPKFFEFVDDLRRHPVRPTPRAPFPSNPSSARQRRTEMNWRITTSS